MTPSRPSTDWRFKLMSHILHNHLQKSNIYPIKYLEQITIPWNFFPWGSICAFHTVRHALQGNFVTDVLNQNKWRCWRPLGIAPASFYPLCIISWVWGNTICKIRVMFVPHVIFCPTWLRSVCSSHNISHICSTTIAKALSEFT